MTQRDAILEGVAGASETHDAFRMQENLGEGARSVDVFHVIDELGLPLEFRALDGLLGTCTRVDDASVGILITTRGDLHLQRFTAAHELGHFVLEHEGSFDREVGMPGQIVGRDPLEVQADAFAAEFLMPKWLIAGAAQRRGWWAADRLSTPEIAYQLSLRLGLSYEATCWGLLAQECISRPAAEQLRKIAPKKSKQAALRGVALEDPWADVWRLDTGDNGATLDAGPTDLFVVELEERASAGFAWDLEQAVANGFSVVSDFSEFDQSIVGGPSMRRLVFRAPARGVYQLQLTLRRSFSSRSSASGTFQTTVSTYGARREGSYGAVQPQPSIH
jgi:Zn-dependent peptidase ImmA (M78 family)/predicted secreted protein